MTPPVKMDRNLLPWEDTPPRALSSVVPHNSLDDSTLPSSPEIHGGCTRHMADKAESYRDRRRDFILKALALYGSISRAIGDRSRARPVEQTPGLRRHTRVAKRSGVVPAGPLGLLSMGFESSKASASRKKVLLAQSRQPARHRQVSLRPLMDKVGRELANNSNSVNPFTIFEVLGARSCRSQDGLESTSGLLQMAANIHHKVEISLATKPSTNRTIFEKQSPVLDIRDLALGKLAVVEDRNSCSFCMFECSFGSSNEDVLLPASSSYHKCTNCQDTHFFDNEYMKAGISHTSPEHSVLRQSNIAPFGFHTASEYHIFVEPLRGETFSLEVKSSDTVLDVKIKLSQSRGMDWDLQHLFSCGAVLHNDRTLSEYRIGKKAILQVIDRKSVRGHDITQFWRPSFCAGCPWGQVDVKLAKICRPCREEKFAIIKHRHGAWNPFYSSSYSDTGDTTPGHKKGNCMICTGIGRMSCFGCPLIVCVDCSVHLDRRCKGSLDLLLYSYSQLHIRNDAFLLRSDGGGI